MERITFPKPMYWGALAGNVGQWGLVVFHPRGNQPHSSTPTGIFTTLLKWQAVVASQTLPTATLVLPKIHEASFESPRLDKCRLVSLQSKANGIKGITPHFDTLFHQPFDFFCQKIKESPIDIAILFGVTFLRQCCKEESCQVCATFRVVILGSGHPMLHTPILWMGATKELSRLPSKNTLHSYHHNRWSPKSYTFVNVYVVGDTFAKVTLFLM